VARRLSSVPVVCLVSGTLDVAAAGHHFRHRLGSDLIGAETQKKYAQNDADPKCTF
jgi:hypothetical protein